MNILRQICCAYIDDADGAPSRQRPFLLRLWGLGDKLFFIVSKFSGKVILLLSFCDFAELHFLALTEQLRMTVNTRPHINWLWQFLITARQLQQVQLKLLIYLIVFTAALLGCWVVIKAINADLI